MKIIKLLSVMMMMNDEFNFGTPFEKNKEQIKAAVEDLYKQILNLKDTGFDYQDVLPPLPVDKVNFDLRVIDDIGNGISSQVKFFPMQSEQTLENFSKVNHRIDMILKQTSMNGQLSVDLPCYIHKGFDKGNIEIEKISRYYIEISKGSEFEIVRQVIDISQTKSPLEKTITLKQLISLAQEGWYAGDLHHHSVYSSPKFGGTDDVIESAEEVRIAMTAMGLSFGALSDHHNILNHQDWISTRTAHFLPIPCKEISTSNGHVMSLNVLEDVIYKIPTQEQRTDEYLYNEFVRIVDEIKTEGGLAQLNHPKDLQPAISLSKPMEDHVELFDTIEIWNGSIPMHKGTTNDHAFKFWLNLLGQDRFIPATTGSDTHNTRADDYHQMMNEIMWISYKMNQRLLDSGLDSQVERDAIQRFTQLIETTIDKLESWAEESLGTGCVRTYISVEGDRPLDSDHVLNALKEGRSFLTNGPLLIPRVLGKSCGESVQLAISEDSLLIDCQIFSNLPLNKLEIISKSGKIHEIDISDLDTETEHKLTITLDPGLLESKDWLVLKIYSDHCNLAITNPIFIFRK